MGDLFPDHQHVWLRSYVHGTYLHADEDGHGVSLSHRRASMNAAWVVHRRYQYVLLHSAATGRYLAATLDPAPRGCRGFRVEQRNYNNLNDNAILWQRFGTFRMNPGDEIRLRHHDIAAHRYRYLRANGKLLSWNANVVSVDELYHITDTMDWEVVPIPTRERIPPLPRPTGLDLLRGRLSVLLPSREVMFEVMFIAGDGRHFSFTFRGRSVFHLRNELASRLRINNANFANNLVMCVRAGTYGRFTPLVVDLPRSRQPLTIRADRPDIGPRYPDFAAE